MPKKPVETLVYTISLYDASVHIKTAYYEQGQLSAVTGKTIVIPRECRDWKRRLTDLLGLDDELVRGVKLWLDQLRLF